jgi:hypothetical protein
MIIVGVILVAAGAAFGIDVVMKNRFTVSDIEVFGNTLGLHHAEQIFLLGALTGAVILLGLVLLVAGVVRSRTKNIDNRRQAGRDHERSADLDDGKPGSRAAARERTAGGNLDGATAVDPSARGDRVSPGVGGSTALDQDA